jgi:hypothetical protein
VEFWTTDCIVRQDLWNYFTRVRTGVRKLRHCIHLQQNSGCRLCRQEKLNTVSTLSDKGRDSAESTLLAFIIPPSYWIQVPLGTGCCATVPGAWHCDSCPGRACTELGITERNVQAMTMSRLVQGDAKSVNSQWWVTAKVQWLSVSIVWANRLARWKYELSLRGNLLLIVLSVIQEDVCPALYYGYSVRHL